MINEVNDTLYCAKELVVLMRKPLYVLNLIRLNSFGKFKASSQTRIANFKKILEQNKIKVSERHSYGGDIAAACGQLANKKL